MIASNKPLNARKAMFVLAASLVISACGGGSGGTGSSNENPAVPAPKPTTGTPGIAFTDKATDEFDSIKLSINEAVLLSDDGQHVVFDELQAIVLFVDTATSTVTTGSFLQLAAGQAVELFGETMMLEDLSTRFEANEILVDGPPPASE